MDGLQQLGEKTTHASVATSQMIEKSGGYERAFSLTTSSASRNASGSIRANTASRTAWSGRLSSSKYKQALRS
ncbi:MAG: hypothetical protein GTO18_17870 [Anaerolineales bacterium]|nr:hypothetical protein [Anaerolineales bacterium]